MPEDPALAAASFHKLRQTLNAQLGLSLGSDKHTFVVSRLSARMRALRVATVERYLEVVESDAGREEREHFIHAITTHETYFFREPRYLDAVVRHARGHRGAGRYRVWSAACSTGAEVYTVAMALLQAGMAPPRIELVGSDVSAEVVAHARRGVFPRSLGAHIPHELLRRYCLEGMGGAKGQFAVKDSLRSLTSFAVHNLMHPATALGQFEVVLIRNVLIYFDGQSKKRALDTVVEQLRPHGLLIVGQAESLSAMAHRALTRVEPAVYVRT